MNSPTPFYVAMKDSLRDASKLVARDDRIECKSHLQHLKLQGYILISHSIFEEYLENLCREAARTAKKVFVDDEIITKALVALISTSVVGKISDRAAKKVSEDLSNNLTLFSTEAINTYFHTISANHGIKSSDQKNLLLPIGIDLAALDIGLSQNLNSFGSQRGSVAHSFKLEREDTLSAVQSQIDNIVRDLEVLDIEACSVCAGPPS
ncbi:HEPN domain-containing protein [Loktanella sp. F6476L]|uniref:HEPN domain-containing protein n=1 Tax=Loktanella sp. F6476L TaxID=2926405 RepID=UPI001FF5CFBB|nr:HEPN domain-containing protein [Loktanella sp. F6476L]MCK0121669.1 HEPN domain-containing protein [Loktanella sp. F6476L]